MYTPKCALAGGLISCALLLWGGPGCMLVGYDPRQQQQGAAGEGGTPAPAEDPRDAGTRSGTSGTDAMVSEIADAAAVSPPPAKETQDGQDAGDPAFDPMEADAAVPSMADAGATCPVGERGCSERLAYECDDLGTRIEQDCTADLPSCMEGLCDPERGCVQMRAEDGAPCDDNDHCTIGDQCSSGDCGGTAVSCADLDDACNVGVCRPQNGMCYKETVADGTACGSGLSCRSGQCVTVADCTAFGDCYVGCSDRGEICAIDCAGIGACEVGCTNETICSQNCTGGVQCTGSCADGSQCTTNCQGSAQCSFTCSGSATCGVDCRGAATCGPVQCQDTAQCEVNCESASSCAVRCEDEAGCLLRCGAATACEFEVCQGTTEVCADGVITCNLPCP